MDVQTPPNCSRVYNPRVPHSLTPKVVGNMFLKLALC